MSNSRKILVYGYGNPGRQDDGLGIHLAEAVQSWANEDGIAQIETDTNYQLNIEDAYNLTKYDVVYFADASIEQIDTFVLDEVTPESKAEFTMHSVSPGFVINLCKEIYGDAPQSYLLHIKGYQWEFMEKMSPKAEDNLKLATNYLINIIKQNLKN